MENFDNQKCWYDQEHPLIQQHQEIQEQKDNLEHLENIIELGGQGAPW